MIIGIVPSRHDSTRFPGKPLIDIEGKSMIEWVIENTRRSVALDLVVVATDDQRIADEVRRVGGEVVMTRTDHTNGTSRCWEAYSKLIASEQVTDDSANYVINIQGDEPFVDPAQIDELTAILDGAVELATQMTIVESAEMLHDQKEAKIVVNAYDEALYFSRQAIPYMINVPLEEWHQLHTYYRQVGMYAYRADVLKKVVQLPVSALEQHESLEQLRWLEAGYAIKLVRTNYQSHCIDEPADVEKLLRRVGRL